MESRQRTYEVDPDTGCWNYRKRAPSTGYGRVMLNYKSYIASRLFYTIHYGHFHPSLDVLHTCDNPACVNPDHLFLGTAKDNVADMIAKGRRRLTSRMRMSDDDVIECRNRWAEGDVSQARLAADYGVSQTHISNIVRGKARTR
jgi:predicted XRE-type DNA-binding protein